MEVVECSVSAVRSGYGHGNRGLWEVIHRVASASWEMLQGRYARAVSAYRNLESSYQFEEFITRVVAWEVGDSWCFPRQGTARN